MSCENAGNVACFGRVNVFYHYNVHLTAEQASAIADPAKVTMCYVNPVTGKTEILPSVYDTATMTLTFTTMYFAEAAEE